MKEINKMITYFVFTAYAQPMGTVQATSVEEALQKAKSPRNPAPMVSLEEFSRTVEFY